MNARARALAGLTAAVLAAAALAACSNSPSSNTSAGGTPVYGGTLRVISNTGPGTLDPVPTYNYAGYELERGYTRQLVTYPTTSPATATGDGLGQGHHAGARRGGAGADRGQRRGHRRRAGVHLPSASGVYWNSAPPRQVTAADFIGEFKAFCNPGQFPVGNSAYFTSTIAGFGSYCSAESSHFSGKGAPAVTAGAVAAWQDSHQISGLSAPSPLTLRVTLTQPAGDFNNIMALPFASARPAEYDAYLPGSARLDQHIMSDGPYEISSYTPNKQIVLTRNPAWRQSTDPVRHQYVKKVVVTLGTSSDQTVLTDIQANSQDLFLADLSIPSQSIASLQAAHDQRLRIWPSSNLNPYVILNLRSPNDGAAMSKLGVREAIEYGVNKSAIVKVNGGPAVNGIDTSAIPPGSVGYQPYTPTPPPATRAARPSARRCWLRPATPTG